MLQDESLDALLVVSSRGWSARDHVVKERGADSLGQAVGAAYANARTVEILTRPAST